MTLLARAIHAPFTAMLAPAAARFARALEDPRRAQQAVLARARLVVPRLERVTRLSELSALPLTTYDDVREHLEHVAARGNVSRGSALTRAPIVRFELSSGSAGAQKLIPITQPFLDEMNRALQPWLFSLLAQPGVARGCAYWSISPIGAKRGRTASGIPIGADDDASYFPAPLRALLARVLAVPSTIASIGDVDACRYATLRLLLQRDDLAFISVWSPTFLTLLMDALDRHRERLLDDLERGTLSVDAGNVASALPLRAMPERARELRAIARERRLEARDVWPNLALLSMWTDAAAAGFVDEARARFPGVALQPKGLLATEGTTSIPWPAASGEVSAPVFAVRSHVIELLDESGRAQFVDEAELGKRYEVVLTTSAGLVRYRTFDRVQVVGRCGATPRVRFVGRTNVVGDLVGEKLGVERVGAVLAMTVPRAARFAMLAPVRVAGRAPHYRLYVEHGDVDVATLARAVDSALSEGHPYRYARELGQLGPVDVVTVTDAARRYELACVARGQRAGDVKPTPLSLRDDWDAALV